MLSCVASNKGSVAIISGGLNDGNGPGYNRHEGFKDMGMGAPPLEGSGEWSAEEEWNSTYKLRLSLLPTSFVPPS